MVFGWAQIIMDIQPLVVLITGEGHLHGFSYTYIGATLVGLGSALTGKYTAEFGLRFIGQDRYLPNSWPVAITSALIGSAVVTRQSNRTLRDRAAKRWSFPRHRIHHRKGVFA